MPGMVESCNLIRVAKLPAAYTCHMFSQEAINRKDLVSILDTLVCYCVFVAENL